jgi:hypothetical protein
MKFRKIALLFLLVGFGISIEALSAMKRVARDVNFDFPDFRFKVSRFSGPSFDFIDEKVVPLDGIREVQVTNEYGDVRVTRTTAPDLTPGTARIVVRKEVFAPHEDRAKEFAQKVTLRARAEGSILFVGTNRIEILGTYGNSARGFGFGTFDEGSSRHISPDDIGMKTHIEVLTRETIGARVENRHGRIDVEGVRSLDAQGEHDDLSATDVSGPCVLKNRHGNLSLVAAEAGCRLSLERGDAHVEALGGPSVIAVAHGELDAIDTAALDLELKFVDLEARNVNGSLRCKGEHNDLRVDGVQGAVTVENRGDVDIASVAGRIEVTNRHGHVRLRRAQGVLVKNSFEDVSVSEIEGPVEVDNDRGGIHIGRVLRGARLKASGDDVEVSDFAGPLVIDVSRGDIRVAPGKPILSGIQATTGGGDIAVAFPKGSQANVDAESERGSVDEDGVPAFTKTDSDRRSLRGRIGAGGEAIVLRSRLGDIRITNDSGADVSDPDEPSSPEIDRRGVPAPPVAPAAPAPAKARVPRPEAPRPPVAPSATPTPLP